MGSRATSQELIELGERIRKRRQELHWSQEKLAEEADISLHMVCRIEGGQTAISVETFKKTVEILALRENPIIIKAILGKELIPYKRKKFKKSFKFGESG